MELIRFSDKSIMIAASLFVERVSSFANNHRIRKQLLTESPKGYKVLEIDSQKKYDKFNL